MVSNIDRYFSSSSNRHVLGNTCHWEEPTSDAYWVIHVTGRNLRILTVSTKIEFGASIYIITMEEYHASGEDILGDTI